VIQSEATIRTNAKRLARGKTDMEKMIENRMAERATEGRPPQGGEKRRKSGSDGGYNPPYYTPAYHLWSANGYLIRNFTV
jgi:hypothetical protein